MRREEHVFERFTAFQNMHDGYRLARKGKRYRPEVLNYTARLEENLFQSIRELKEKTYRIENVHEFYEYFPKKRIITAWPFYNRVINCAAYNVIWPVYRKSFYEHNYGSIAGKGPLKAAQQIQYWMRQAKYDGKYKWIGKADIAKFFFRVPHEVQIRELMKPFRDPDMEWFLRTCIKGDGRPTGLPIDCADPGTAERIHGIGMPVGSLISQITGNVVLTPLDHYMKRVVKIPIFLRYMDDEYLQGESKGQIWDALGAMDDFLRKDFGLQLNDKTAVMPYDAGVEFVGRIIRPESMTLRRETSLKAKQHLRYVREHYGRGEMSLGYAESVIQSYLGLTAHSDSGALKEALCRDYVLIRHSGEKEAWEDRYWEDTGMRKFYEVLDNPDGTCDIIIPEAARAACETGEDYGIRLYIVRDVEKTDGLESDIREHYETWKRMAEVVEI